MSIAVAPELREEIVSCTVRPEHTARLARIYYRSVARVLWRSLAVEADPPGGELGWRDVLWLHPRAVYACALVTAGRPIPPDWRRDVALDLRNALDPAPELEHLPGPVRESWYEDGLKLLGQGRAVPANSPRLRPTTRPINAASAAMAEACHVMARVWPQAAMELRTLLRVVVYCDGSVSSSSTAESTFGAIYVRRDWIDGVVAAFDTLLHEVGHHTLILRNSFELFLTNSLHESSHPLRPDPRPLHGGLFTRSSRSGAR